MLFLSGIATYAYADTGRINIDGALTNETCTVATNSGGPDALVAMRTMPVAKLAANAESADMGSFDISISNCAKTNVYASFMAGNPNLADLATNNLRPSLTALSAQNIQVALYNEEAGVVKKVAVGDPSSVITKKIDTNKKANLHFVTRYKSTGAHTEGTIATSAVYTLAYD
ncbi:hypothetical protein JCM19000A_35090 [Silvimonas sp. JCM 19000]